MKKIVAFVPNILNFSPGQRIRIETWAKHLDKFGWEVEFFPFEDESLNEIFYKPGNNTKKSLRLMRCFLNQAKNVIANHKCDVVFIYREASLIGPALLERVLKYRNIPIVYDLDDPIFLPYISPVNKKFSLLKFSKKTHSLFRFSDHIISINGIIGDYAKKYNPHVTVIPNFVDVSTYKPGIRQEGAEINDVRIGWTGSISTLQNLDVLKGPLRILQQESGVKIRLIANGTTKLEGVELEQKAWSADKEVSYLQDCDIGIVPLTYLEWNPWKFFLKTIQYMAIGLPVVAQKIGSNSEVIEDGVTGFLVESEEEWLEKLRLLIKDRSLRLKIGAAARKVAVKKYSVEAQMPQVAAVFDKVYRNTNASAHA